MLKVCPVDWALEGSYVGPLKVEQLGWEVQDDDASHYNPRLESESTKYAVDVYLTISADPVSTCKGGPDQTWAAGKLAEQSLT